MPSVARLYNAHSVDPLRFEVKAIQRPSGDHTGIRSNAGSVVNRVETPRFTSSSQTSAVPSTRDEVARRLASGDSELLYPSPKSDPGMVSNGAPDRSNHTKWCCE